MYAIDPISVAIGYVIGIVLSASLPYLIGMEEDNENE
jgi:hypothetical protein